MNFKLLFKSILILAVLALLVILGINNTQSVTLVMKPLMPKSLPLQTQAGYMYFGFFGVGFLVGALMMAGGGGGGKKSSSKPAKEK